MLHNLTFMRSPTQFLHKNTHKLHDLNLPTPKKPTTLSPPNIKTQCSRYSRRELTIFTSSSLILLSTFRVLDPPCLYNAQAEEDDVQQVGTKESVQQVEDVQQVGTEESVQVEDVRQVGTEESVQQVDDVQQVGTDESVQQVVETNLKGSSGCNGQIPTKKAFLDVSIDGEPTGTIIIGLYGENAPIGAARFSDLVSGKAGISFRRKEFVRITPNYVQHGGIRSYGVDAELARRTGGSLTNDNLIGEWKRINEECEGIKNLAGTVSIVVRDPTKPPPKMKLVARKGKLMIDEEEQGVEPNGTEFTIATKDSPELDSSALVVGKVIEGMDVVKRIGEVKTVQENTSSPYFRAAKLIGDKRAVVAERGFNRPYSKVKVMNCGLLE